MATIETSLVESFVGLNVIDTTCDNRIVIEEILLAYIKALTILVPPVVLHNLQLIEPNNSLTINMKVTVTSGDMNALNKFINNLNTLANTDLPEHICDNFSNVRSKLIINSTCTPELNSGSVKSHLSPTDQYELFEIMGLHLMSKPMFPKKPSLVEYARLIKRSKLSSTSST